jgi:hypothetical protein
MYDMAYGFIPQANKRIVSGALVFSYGHRGSRCLMLVDGPHRDDETNVNSKARQSRRERIKLSRIYRKEKGIVPCVR